MKPKRIIPCLDVKDGRVVKGIQFVRLRDAGDPVELAEVYNREGADELVLLDVGATGEGRLARLDLVRRVAERLTIPLMVGGGVSRVEDVKALQDAGAAKVSIGSAAVRDPAFIDRAVGACGRAAIIVAVDVRRDSEAPSGWEVMVGGGRQPTGRDVLAWVRELEARGAGELLITSIDADGTQDGYDNELYRTVTDAVTLPVIASGGAGTVAHLKDAFIEGKVDAVLAASMFHYGKVRISEAKAYLRRHGVPVREVTVDGSSRTEI